MRAILNKIIGEKSRTVFDYTSVMVVYQLDKTTWRGFVMPFDITFEAESRDKVIEVLRDMVNSYIDGLKEYNNSSNLSNVPLSYEHDLKKWHDISLDLTNKLLNKVSRVDTSDYYAEAQLPA